MYIHNYFQDVLLSFTILFDNYVFQSNLIKSYEFNISNRSFSLSKVDYRPSFEFPACIITLNTDTPSFGERPTTVQRSPIENYNQIPVLRNKRNLNTIYVQEEHTQISVSIVINCESQLQAKEIEFHVRRITPINRYLQIFDFTSFLEIPENLLVNNGFILHEDEIINLFTKFNKSTGLVDYCYSLNYKPLIKLDSTSVSIADSTQRSFPVNLEYIYQIQMPMWVCLFEDKPIIENINVNFSRFGNEPISYHSTKALFQISTGRKVLRSLLINSLKDFDYIDIPDTNKFSFSIRFDPNSFIISVDYEFDIFDVFGTIHKNIKPSLVDNELNKVIFEFETKELQYYDATLKTPIIVQFIELSTQV